MDGIVANIEDSTIENCTNLGIVNGYSAGLSSYGVVDGGIAGWAKNSTIKKSKNKAKVYIALSSGALGDRDGALGGICGGIQSSTIEQCYNTGYITAKNTNNSFCLNNIGGIVGYGLGGYVKNSFNIGNVEGYSCIGGISGFWETKTLGINEGGHIENCYNASTNVTGSYEIGDLCGHTEKITGNYVAYVTSTPLGYDNSSTWSNYAQYTQTQMKTVGSGLLTLLQKGNGSGLWAQSSTINNGYPYLVNNIP